MKEIGKRRQQRREPGEPRGILRHPPGAGDFHHARIGPRPELADLIQHFWIVRWDLRDHPPQRRQTLPHPSVHLVLQRGRSRLVGVQTGRFSTTLEGRGDVLGIKYRPGGFRPLWPRPVIELRDRELPAQALFGDAVASLEETLFAADDDAAMIAAAERFLLERRPPANPQASLAGDIVDGIAEDRTLLRVEHVQARWHSSARSLQRLFREYVGVSPKWVINRYRLHEAVERLDGGEPLDWAQLALDLGYFDQAHFIRDFKAVIGMTPGQYARQSWPRRAP